MQSTYNLLEIARGRRNIIEKRERKTKNEKTSNYNNKYFFYFYFLYRKKNILLKVYWGKLSLCCYICIRVFYMCITITVF